MGLVEVVVLVTGMYVLNLTDVWVVAGADEMKVDGEPGTDVVAGGAGIEV